MIKNSKVYSIGRLAKTHGIKGEIVFFYSSDIFDRVDCPYLILKVDEILVPFFIKEYRLRNDGTALIIFDGYETEEKAKKLANLDAFFPTKYQGEEDENKDVNEDEYSWDFFIGFTVKDTENTEIGIIREVDDNTLNTLFVIEKGDKEFLIPADENFIKQIDPDDKTIIVELIDGLLDLN